MSTPVRADGYYDMVVEALFGDFSLAYSDLEFIGLGCVTFLHPEPESVAFLEGGLEPIPELATKEKGCRTPFIPMV